MKRKGKVMINVVFASEFSNGPFTERVNVVFPMGFSVLSVHSHRALVVEKYMSLTVFLSGGKNPIPQPGNESGTSQLSFECSTN